MKRMLLPCALLLWTLFLAPVALAQTVQTPCANTSSCVFRNKPGALLDAYATAEATAGYLYVFNATSAPANGAVTAGIASGNYEQCLYVPANTSLGIAVTGTPPLQFSAGITAVFSSTACGTLTAANAYFISGRTP